MGFKLTGGCNCGAVRFELTAPLVSAVYCHCRRCQRRSGTAASANGRVEPGSFRLLSGEDRLRAWRPPDGAEKWFCGDCGSALYSRASEDPSRMGVRLGAIDGDPRIRPSARQYVAYAARWEAIPDDGLPRYPEAVTDASPLRSPSGRSDPHSPLGGEGSASPSGGDGSTSPLREPGTASPPGGERPR